MACKNKTTTETETPPEGYRTFLYFIRNLRRNWYKILCYFICIFVLWNAKDIWRKGNNIFYSHFGSVSARVVNFDKNTGDLKIIFNNETQNPVPVSCIYVTFDSTNAVPMQPLPPNLQSLVSILSKSFMRVPGGAAWEVKHIPGKADSISLGAILIHKSQAVILPPGNAPKMV